LSLVRPLGARKRARKFKAPCKLIAKDTDHVTALSLAENTMQEPMAPLEEYEAFAAMIADSTA